VQLGTVTFPTLSSGSTGLTRFATQLQLTYTQTVDDESTGDYSYALDSGFTAEWYQPKYAKIYLNQYRFSPGMKVKAWHYDGETATWYTADDIEITTANSASTLAAGAACLLGVAASLAF